MPTEGRRRRLKSGQVEAQRAGATALMVPQARCLSCGLEWLMPSRARFADICNCVARVGDGHGF